MLMPVVNPVIVRLLINRLVYPLEPSVRLLVGPPSLALASIAIDVVPVPVMEKPAPFMVMLSAEIVKQVEVPDVVTFCVRVYVPDSINSPQVEMLPARRASAFDVLGKRMDKNAKNIPSENISLFVNILFVRTFCIFVVSILLVLVVSQELEVLQELEVSQV